MADLPDGFIAHDGGPCPIEGRCDVMFRDGFVAKGSLASEWAMGTYDWWRGQHPEAKRAIIAYRPTTPQEAGK